MLAYCDWCGKEIEPADRPPRDFSGWPFWECNLSPLLDLFFGGHEHCRDEVNNRYVVPYRAALSEKDEQELDDIFGKFRSAALQQLNHQFDASNREPSDRFKEIMRAISDRSREGTGIERG
ncbi:MAG: hypothetical protein ABSG17_11250 [Spirochaetia bacterium]|jgi:hypothetical protein